MSGLAATNMEEEEEEEVASETDCERTTNSSHKTERPASQQLQHTAVLQSSHRSKCAAS